jgi:hypothetical protein
MAISMSWNLFEGETLENLIERSGRLRGKLALEIAMQLLAGLSAVHRQKLVHRDIKPVIVAWAGVGKSTLVNHWLKQMVARRYRPAELSAGHSTPRALVTVRHPRTNLFPRLLPGLVIKIRGMVRSGKRVRGWRGLSQIAGLS